MRGRVTRYPADWVRNSRQEVNEMAVCEVCGNDYDKAFEVRAAGSTHMFDSFECAIHALAPICDHCGCKIIGHGVEADGKMFCCAHCASEEGVTELRDRV
jgi:Rieske Fe-S protein